MVEYLKLVQRVLDHGIERGDRTGVGTLSLFGTQTRYNLQDGFPLVTTKKVNYKALIHELLWFLSGSTNTNDLKSKIWDDWAAPNGELGPIYGYQWRNWGGTGIDQVRECIETIKTNPESRRIIVSAWNVEDVPSMALPPCHLLFQFYVREGKFLDCQLYQRSADLALGVPFNIASYALLMHLMANDCGLKPGEFVHTIGDTHVYMNHIDGLREQLTRDPTLFKLPHLKVANKPIDDITFEDIEIIGYESYPSIKFAIAV